MRGPFKGFALTAVRDATSFCFYIVSYQYICDSLTPDYEVNEPSAGICSTRAVRVRVDYNKGEHINGGSFLGYSPCLKSIPLEFAFLVV